MPSQRSTGSRLAASVLMRSSGTTPALTTVPESRADTSRGASALVRGSHSPATNTSALVSRATVSRASTRPLACPAPSRAKLRCSR